MKVQADVSAIQGHVAGQPQQTPSKAIKKKSLLNFRAIKNNYVVKPTNTGMSMVENELPPSSKNVYMTNSAMASNNHANNSSKRKHGANVRASHSQFSDEHNRIVNTGYLSQRSSATGANGQQANQVGLAPVADHSDPHR